MHGNEFGDYFAQLDFEGECIGEYLCHILYALTEKTDKYIMQMLSDKDKLERLFLNLCEHDILDYILHKTEVEPFKDAFKKVLEDYEAVTEERDIWVHWGDDTICRYLGYEHCKPIEMRIQGIEVITLDVDKYGLHDIINKVKKIEPLFLGKLTITTKEECKLDEYPFKGISGSRKLFEKHWTDLILDVLNRVKLSTLTLDIDLNKIKDKKLLYNRMIELSRMFGRDNISVFQSTKGYHIYVKLGKEMDFNDLIKLREYYLDDPDRIKYDLTIYKLTKTPAYTNMLFRVKFVNGKLVHVEKSITWEEFIEEIRRT